MPRTMMKIDDLWSEMEAEGGSSWRTRLARDHGANPLVLALEPSNRSRVFLVPVPGIVLPARREWPECRGLEWLSVSLDQTPYWGVRLRDSSCEDVFSALASDLDRRLERTAGTEEAAAELLGRLKRWQQFLKVWQEGMGLEARRGLWGELHVLRTCLMPTVGAKEAVEGWKAGTAAHQDFQFSHAAVEVKTTAAKQPQSVRITSERQLDETGVGMLFLHVVVVDEREVAMFKGAPGTSLPAMVEDIRTELADDSATLLLFNELLFQRGWLDEHAARYESHRLTLRDQISHRIGDGFPRLIEGDLPTGVGDVAYALALAACGPFIVPLREMLELVGGGSDTNPLSNH